MALGNGIIDFYKTATSKGFARANLFRVKQITNQVFDEVSNDTTANLYLYVQEGTIPARNISTATVDFKSFKFNIPMAANYPDSGGGWTVTFFCDKEYILREVLENWSVGTFDEHSGVAALPNWWDCDVVLSVLDNSSTSQNSLVGSVLNILGIGGATSAPGGQDYLQEIRTYTLKGAFPTAISSIGYKMADGGTIATASVNVAFQYVISENLNSGGSSNTNELNLLTNVVQQVFNIP